MRPHAWRSLVIATVVLGLSFAHRVEAQIADRLPGPVVTPGGDVDLDPRAIVEFSVAGSLVLAPLTSAELLGTAATSFDRGAWFPGADPTGGVSVNTGVSRSATTVWSAWFTQQGNNTNNIQVQMALYGLDGTLGYLTHLSESSSRMAVAVTPGNPVLIGTQGKRRNIGGGATFLINCSEATRGGTYGGTLVVTVNQL